MHFISSWDTSLPGLRLRTYSARLTDQEQHVNRPGLACLGTRALFFIDNLASGGLAGGCCSFRSPRGIGTGIGIGTDIGIHVGVPVRSAFVGRTPPANRLISSARPSWSWSWSWIACRQCPSYALSISKHQQSTSTTNRTPSQQFWTRSSSMSCFLTSD